MDINKDKITTIAYYLPQFYEIEFNNNYWGKGYTEWTVTAKGKPLFKGHYQPHIPADLGFYNLLMPEAREAQAKMAKEYGVDGFCYWHYWFGNGKTIMEKPFKAIMESGKPDFPFCLCWANHTWHNPSTKESILKQEYLGNEDNEKHFYYLLDAFKDERYIKVNNKPIFAIFDPLDLPNVNQFIEQWNKLAKENDLEGFYFIGLSQTPDVYVKIKDYNFDAINTIRLKDFLAYRNKYQEYLKYKLGYTHDYSYDEALKHFVEEDDYNNRNIPTIIPGWDHTPRSGKNGLILTDYTPKAFKKHLHSVFEVLNKKENKLCFIKAWNEWGEGNHLEPDLKWGTQFLEVLKETKDEYSKE